MNLGTSQIELASVEAITSTLADLQPTIRIGRWLPMANVLRHRHIGQIDDACAYPFKALADAPIRQLVAAAGPTHCYDGWAYLARAADCLLTGDARAALHLAYYAELRAAASLLACSGVGVFADHHVIVDENGQDRKSVV